MRLRYLGAFLVTFGVCAAPLPDVVFGDYVISADGVYTAAPGTTFTGANQLNTSNPSLFGGVPVEPIIGSDRFLTAGYDGDGTSVMNIEAGHVWDGHDTLTHVMTQVQHGSADGGYDRHATWVGGHIGGRNSAVPTNLELGIAPGTDLQSGAIATSWSGSPYAQSFNIGADSLYTPYNAAAGTVDVINSSWGGADPAGSGFITVEIDGFAFRDPGTTVVMSAGNSGPGANTVGGPGSGYNGITVGALANGGNTYGTIAGFSSRSPSDYIDPVNGTVAGVRAAVDIAAPGASLVAPFYGGTTGGNTGGSASGGPSSYSSVGGTSFASPITAGVVTLMHDAAYDQLTLTAHDSRVIKASLLNAASKPAGWNNGQSGGALVSTSQALDYTYGAGSLNADAAFDQYLSGQTDVPGLGGGASSAVLGWDFGRVGLAGGSTFDLVLSSVFDGTQPFTATLAWFRERAVIDASTVADISFFDLDLELWDSTFTTQIAESVSGYNSVEHFHLPALGTNSALGLRVVNNGALFDFGTILPGIDFGLAWSGTMGSMPPMGNPIPEPGTWAIFGLLLVCSGRWLRLQQARG